MTTNRFSVGVVALCMCAGAAVAANARWNVVAVTGSQAPGLSLGMNFQNGGIGTPQIDVTGNIFFRSLISGTGVTTTNDGALFAFPASGSTMLVAREGDVAPGTGGAQFLAISNPVFSNGRVAFIATLTGAGVVTSNSQAIFAGTPDAITMVARKGELVAITGANIGSINEFALAANGTVAFRVILVGGPVTFSNDTCVMLSIAGITTVAGREGTLLPTISATAKIGDLGSGPLVATSQGFAEAVAPLTGAGSGSTNTLFRYSLTGPEIIARAKTAAPGLPAGVNFLDIPQITTANSSGTSFFQGLLTGPGIFAGNSVGIWQGSPGNVTLTFRLNSYAADTGLSFQALTSSPSVNDWGMMVFSASLWGPGSTSTNSAGIFKLIAGQHSMIARAGNLVPDLDDGSVYTTDAPGRVLVNNSGLVFVKMRSFSNSVSRDGLFVFRPNGTMSTLMREGDSFQVGPSDLRTISAIWVASAGNSVGADGRGAAVGGVDKIVLQLAFAEGGNAIVEVFGGCGADFNADGQIDFFDYLDFVDAFAIAADEADFNGDGVVDFFDYLDFVDAFSIGC